MIRTKALLCIASMLFGVTAHAQSYYKAVIVSDEGHCGFSQSSVPHIAYTEAWHDCAAKGSGCGKGLIIEASKRIVVVHCSSDSHKKTFFAVTVTDSETVVGAAEHYIMNQIRLFGVGFVPEDCTTVGTK